LRQPCPRCGESIPFEARICAHCHSDVLFEVRATTAISDSRIRYHIARNLESVADLDLAFLDLKRNLDEAPGIVVPPVTRAVATVCHERLEHAGIAASVVYHPTNQDDQRGVSPWSPAAIAASAAAFLRERPGTALAIVVGIALVAAAVGLGGNGDRRTVTAAKPISTQELAVLAERATVHLSCDQTLGAGFFITPDLVVTNAHVLCPDTSEITVTMSDGESTTGRVVSTDKWLDLGLIRVSNPSTRPLRLADATHLERGDPVVMMGSPRGMDFTLSRGIVSHPNRAMMGISYLQIDAAVNPGNSGGPLLDEAGRAVGIVSMMVGSASNLGLALPVNYLFDGPDALLADHKVQYDRDRWAARVGVATEADRQDVADARANAIRPGVVEAQIMGQGTVVALVVRLSESRPQDEHLKFTLSRSGSEICSPSAIASRWRRINTGNDGQQGSRYMMWLERHGLTRDVFASPVHLGMAGCPGPSSVMGATLILRNGAQHADQVVVRSGSERGW